MRAARIFLAGTGMGAVLALIFAPRSGKKVRQLIAERAHEGLNQVAAGGKRLRRGLRDLAEKAEQRQRRTEAFAAGRQG